MAELQTFQINTGLKRFVIKNELNENIGEIRIHPADVSIVDRYQKIVKQDLKKIDELTRKDDDSASLGDIDIGELNNTIIHMFDTLLSCNSAESIFSTMYPLCIIEDGSFYYEAILNYVADIIVSVFGERVEKRKQNVQKYTSKYEY